MANTVKTMKLHIHMNDSDISSVEYMTEQYRLACNFVSQYIIRVRRKGPNIVH